MAPGPDAELNARIATPADDAGEARLRPLPFGREVDQWLARLEAAASPASPRYRFALDAADGLLEIQEPLAGRPDGHRAWQRVARDPVEMLQADGEEAIAAADLALLQPLAGLRRSGEGLLELAGIAGAQAMQRLAEAHRLVLGAAGDRLLAWAEPRKGTLAWRADARRSWRIVLEVPGAAAVVATEPPCYVDFGAGAIGAVALDLPGELAARLMRSPPLGFEQLSVVAPRVAVLSAAHGVAIETPPLLAVVDAGSIAPRARLACRPARQLVGWDGVEGVGRAELSFAYGPLRVAGAPADRVVFGAHDGGLWRVERDLPFEERAMARLAAIGFVADETQRLAWPQVAAVNPWQLRAPDPSWPQILANAVPSLRREGWEVVVTPDFPFAVVEPTAWRAAAPGGVEAAASVDLAFDVELQGRSVAVAWLVDALVERLGREGLEAALADAAPHARLLLPWSALPGPAAAWREPGAHDRLRLPRGATARRWIGLEAARLAPIVPRLLAAGARGGPGRPRLAPASRARHGDASREPVATVRLVRTDLDLVAALDRAGFEMPQLAEWRAAARALGGADRAPAVRPSPRLRAHLRPYQADGLNWLALLRAHRLHGILADDMGLGKTLQVLALLLGELDAGRLVEPALVVVPTSVLHNWLDQAARYAPDLSLVVHHGIDRAPRIEAATHVVLTSYSVLLRDAEQLAALEWHYLVLDESHHVKNARSQAARVIARLTARHRLFLTGTPLENHLGELWSQFNLLMPGLLGDARTFQRDFRVPIERHGDARRSAALRARIAPYMLRRTKEDVARDLPPKSEIVMRVELDPGQRALYDALHAAQSERVRASIDRGDPSRSRVVVLAALLKLRQACCDPALLRTSGPLAPATSAKRRLLLEWLPELVDEGRRIIVFSSFASMLDLLAEDLRHAGIAFSKLTGSTASAARAAQIEAFQSRQRPVFLVSLKAGGVGLDLSAADTVVLFDPWWNPAAERQAADRAHRIGQERPVFVYRLIAADTVEEGIAELQRRKLALAGRLLQVGELDALLDDDDLRTLFEKQGSVGGSAIVAPKPR